MTEMSKILTAFTWSMFLSILAGLAAHGLLFWLEFPWWIWSAAACGFTVISAWIDSRELLARRLGRRYEPSIRLSGRSIPIDTGGLAAVFETILPGTKKTVVDLEDELSIMTATGILISSERVKHFISRSWARQLRGLSGLSRTYWTSEHRPPWDRSEYDAVLYVLEGGQFVENRKAGRSGKLNSDYGTIIRSLRAGR